MGRIDGEIISLSVSRAAFLRYTIALVTRLLAAIKHWRRPCPSLYVDISYEFSFARSASYPIWCSIYQVVENWKWAGRALCRLLRMADFWVRFTADQSLSDKERAARRISVLQEVCKHPPRYLCNYEHE